MFMHTLLVYSSSIRTLSVFVWYMNDFWIFFIKSWSFSTEKDVLIEWGKLFSAKIWGTFFQWNNIHILNQPVDYFHLVYQRENYDEKPWSCWKFYSSGVANSKSIFSYRIQYFEGTSECITVPQSMYQETSFEFKKQLT